MASLLRVHPVMQATQKNKIKYFITHQSNHRFCAKVCRLTPQPKCGGNIFPSYLNNIRNIKYRKAMQKVKVQDTRTMNNLRHSRQKKFLEKQRRKAKKHHATETAGFCL